MWWRTPLQQLVGGARVSGGATMCTSEVDEEAAHDDGSDGSDGGDGGDGVGRRVLHLRPQGARAVDGFLSVEEQTSIRELLRRGSDARFVPEDVNGAEVLSSSPPEWLDAPPHDQQELLKLLAKVHLFVNERVRLHGSLLPGRYRWRPEVGLHLGAWSIYDYMADAEGQASTVAAHTDTDFDGRCLSAALHLPTWQLGDAAVPVEGGVFETVECVDPQLDCDGLYGDALFRIYESEALSGPGALQTVQSATFQPGRLVLFMAESLHRVSPLLRGHRNVLFLWFHCDPALTERYES